MPQGLRIGWVRTVFASLGVTLCVGLFGCDSTDKPKDSMATKQPGTGLPGTPTLQPSPYGSSTSTTRPPTGYPATGATGTTGTTGYPNTGTTGYPNTGTTGYPNTGATGTTGYPTTNGLLQPGPASTTIGSNPAAGLGGVQQTGGSTPYSLPNRFGAPTPANIGPTGGGAVPAPGASTQYNSNPPQLQFSDPGPVPPSAPLSPIRQ